MLNGKSIDAEKKISKYSKLEKRSFPFVYLFIAFPVLQFLIFWVYVNFSSIMIAFRDPLGNFTLANFKTVYNAFTTMDSYGFNLSASMGRSFAIWITTYGLCFPISIVTTYILFRRIIGHYVFRICYIIPSLMGAVIWTTLISYFVAYDGIFVKIIKDMGITLPPLVTSNGLFGDPSTAFPTILAITFITNLVGNNVVLTGAFSRIPDEIFESAKLDGAGFWVECTQIAIPCVWSTIATLLTFALCSILTADNNIFLYSGGTGEPEMSTIGFQLYYLTYMISQNGENQYLYGYPAALGLVLTLFTLPLVLIGRKLLDKVQENVEL